MRKGDTVKIINPKHFGFGEVVKIIGQSKHKYKLIIFFEVENDTNRYFCKEEELSKNLE